MHLNMSASDRPQKITFAEMREMGVRGLLIYCADYRCSHSIAISGDAWPNNAKLSDIEERFTCRVCGKRGAPSGYTSATASREIQESIPLIIKARQTKSLFSVKTQNRLNG